jgi:hypothetical protein
MSLFPFYEICLGRGQQETTVQAVERIQNEDKRGFGAIAFTITLYIRPEYEIHTVITLLHSPPCITKRLSLDRERDEANFLESRDKIGENECRRPETKLTMNLTLHDFCC